MVNGSDESIVDIILSDFDQAAGSMEQQRQGHSAAMHTSSMEKAVEEDEEGEEAEGEGEAEGEEEGGGGGEEAAEGEAEGEEGEEEEGECMPSASSSCLNGDDSFIAGGDHDNEGDEDAGMELAHTHSAYSASSYAEPRAGKALREVDSSTLSRDSNLSESGGNEAACLEEAVNNASMSMSMSCSPTAGDAVEQKRGSDHRSVIRVDRPWGTGTEVDNCHERLYQQGMKRNSKRGQNSEVATCSTVSIDCHAMLPALVEKLEE